MWSAGSAISMSYNLSGRHRAHDVVGDAARAAVRAVEMEVRVVELVRMRGVAGQDIAVGRQVVDEPDLQGLARLHAQRRPQPAFVSAQVEARAADVAIGVSASTRVRFVLNASSS